MNIEEISLLFNQLVYYVNTIVLLLFIFVFFDPLEEMCHSGVDAGPVFLSTFGSE